MAYTGTKESKRRPSLFFLSEKRIHFSDKIFAPKNKKELRATERNTKMDMIHEVIEGLKIFALHDKADICAEHDEIFADCSNKLNASEAEKLEELNWRQTDPDNNPGSWSYIV